MAASQMEWHIDSIGQCDAVRNENTMSNRPKTSSTTTLYIQLLCKCVRGARAVVRTVSRKCKH